MIGAIVLLEASFFLIFNTIEEICFFGMPKIFAATVFFSVKISE